MWKKIFKYGFRIAIGASMIAAIVIGPVMGCSFNDIGSSNDMTPDFDDTPVHPSLGIPLKNQLNKSQYEERRKLLEAEIPEKCELDENGMPIGDCEPPDRSRKGRGWREGRGILNWILDKSITEETIYRSPSSLFTDIDLYNYKLISSYLHSIDSVDEAKGIYNLPLKGTIEEQDILIEEMFKDIRYRYQLFEKTVNQVLPGDTSKPPLKYRQREYDKWFSGAVSYIYSNTIYTSGPEIPIDHQVNRGNRRYWTASKYPMEAVGNWPGRNLNRGGSREKGYAYSPTSWYTEYDPSRNSSGSLAEISREKESLIKNSFVTYDEVGFFSSDVDWESYSSNLIQKLEGKKGYFLHFTADWCGICIAQKPYIDNDRVAEVLEELDIIPIKADFTRSNSAALKALKKYNRVGIPFYVFVDKDGNETTLDSIRSTQTTLDYLRDLA